MASLLLVLALVAGQLSGASPALAADPSNATTETSATDPSTAATDLNTATTTATTTGNKSVELFSEEGITTQAELEAALAKAALTAGTVTLTQDIALSTSLNVPAYKAFVLDGNGFSLTLADGFAGRHINARNFTVAGTAFRNLTFAGNGVGGGIRVEGDVSGLTFSNCTFSNNFADGGAALYLNGKSVVTAINCNFVNNIAMFSGGAIFTYGVTTQGVYSYFTATNCKFEGNQARGTRLNEGGGALYNNHQTALFTLDGCTFVANTSANKGGAIQHGILNITDTSFTNNNAAVSGGAIFSVVQGSAPGVFTGMPRITIHGGSFTNNNANGGYGGAIATNLFESWGVNIHGTSFQDNYASIGYFYSDYTTPIDELNGLYASDFFAHQSIAATRYAQDFTDITAISVAPEGYPTSENVINNYDVSDGSTVPIRLDKGTDAEWIGDAANATSDILYSRYMNSEPLEQVFNFFSSLVKREGYVLMGFANSDTQVSGYNADAYIDIDGYSVLDTDPSTANGFLRGYMYLTPVWAKAANVTYHLDDNTSAADPRSPFHKDQSDVSVLSLSDIDETWAEPAGMVFMGWATTDGGEVTYQAGDTMTVADDTDLYAVWGYAEFSISFVDPMNVANTNPTGYTIKDLPMALSDLSATGYIFDGWYDNAECTGTAIAAIPADTTGDLVYFAKWSAIHYTVTYAPGAHGAFAPQVNDDLIYESVTPAAPVATGESNWQFTGWSPDIAATVTEDATYTAQWIEIFTVTFVDWDGTELKSERVVYGNSAVAPDNPAREGYDFDGWDTAFANVNSDLTVTALYLARPVIEPPVVEPPVVEPPVVEPPVVEPPVVEPPVVEPPVVEPPVVEPPVVEPPVVEPPVVEPPVVEPPVVEPPATEPPAETETPTLEPPAVVDPDDLEVDMVDTTDADEPETAIIIDTTPVASPDATYVPLVNETARMISISAAGSPLVGEDIAKLQTSDTNTPLAEGNHQNTYWALLNLIMAVIGIALALITAIYVFTARDRRSQSRHGSRSTNASGMIGAGLAAITAFVGVVVFLLTEDISQPMTLIDDWTLLMVIITVAVIIGMVIGFFFAEEKDARRVNAYR